MRSLFLQFCLIVFLCPFAFALEGEEDYNGQEVLHENLCMGADTNGDDMVDTSECDEQYLCCLEVWGVDGTTVGICALARLYCINHGHNGGPAVTPIEELIIDNADIIDDWFGF